MNRVGHPSPGEILWLDWFLSKILHDFAGIGEARGHPERAAGRRGAVHELPVVLGEPAPQTTPDPVAESTFSLGNSRDI